MTSDDIFRVLERVTKTEGSLSLYPVVPLDGEAQAFEASLDDDQLVGHGNTATEAMFHLSGQLPRFQD